MSLIATMVGLISITSVNPAVLTVPVPVYDFTSTTSIRTYVEQSFLDTPKIVPIVECESGFRQFTASGTPLVSSTSDVGIMQINQVHWKRAKELGLDVFNSAEDNVAMGKIVLEEQGLSAWTCNRLIAASSLDPL